MCERRQISDRYQVHVMSYNNIIFFFSSQARLEHSRRDLEAEEDQRRQEQQQQQQDEADQSAAADEFLSIVGEVRVYCMYFVKKHKKYREKCTCMYS